MPYITIGSFGGIIVWSSIDNIFTKLLNKTNNSLDNEGNIFLGFLIGSMFGFRIYEKSIKN